MKRSKTLLLRISYLCSRSGDSNPANYQATPHRSAPLTSWRLKDPLVIKSRELKITIKLANLNYDTTKLSFKNIIASVSLFKKKITRDCI